MHITERTSVNPQGSLTWSWGREGSAVRCVNDQTRDPALGVAEVESLVQRSHYRKNGLWMINLDDTEQ
jgi:hypothetical protein